jgi:hypothetical protein
MVRMLRAYQVRRFVLRCSVAQVSGFGLSPLAVCNFSPHFGVFTLNRRR